MKYVFEHFACARIPSLCTASLRGEKTNKTRANAKLFNKMAVACDVIDFIALQDEKLPFSCMIGSHLPPAYFCT